MAVSIVHIHQSELGQCLSLAAVANVGGQEFAESLTQDVQRLLVSPYELDINCPGRSPVS